MRPWLRPAVLGLVAVGVMLGAVLLAARPAAVGGGQAAPAEIGGPFTLVDTRGHAVTERDFKGKPSLMFFGFTYCPEVCPTTLTHMTAWLKALGPDADKLNVAYISIDPERDTPKQMGEYLSAFDPRIRGLTGTPAQVAKIVQEYGVYYKRIPLEGGSYTMDHSTFIYGLNRDGRLAATLLYQQSDAEAVKTLRKLIAS